MKKIICMLLAMCMAVCCTYTAAFGAALEEQAFNSGSGGGGGTAFRVAISDESLYISLSGNKICWGGGLTFSKQLSEKNYSLVLGFYDGTRMIHTYMTELDKDITAFSFAEQTVRLAYAPVSVCAKAFLWSSAEGCVPLCTAVAMQDRSAAGLSGGGAELFAVDITETFFRINSAGSDINMVEADGKYYLSGSVNADISGYDMYDIVVRVMVGENDIVYEDTITADSRMNMIAMKQELDFAPTEFMYTAIGFVRGGKEEYSWIYNDFGSTPDIPKPDKELIEVYGRITATPEQGAVQKGYADLSIEYAEDFEGKPYDCVKWGYSDHLDINVKTSQSMLDNLFVYGRFMLSAEGVYPARVYTIESFEPVGNSIVKYAAEDYNSFVNGSNGKTIDFTISTTSSKTYKLDNNVVVYVNGVEVTQSFEFAVYNYIDGNDTGSVTLIDTPQLGSSSKDGYYDYIMVTMQKWAVVDSTAVLGTVSKIFFDDFEMGLDSSVSLDSADEQLDYSITKNGENIDFFAIKKNDVLLLTYDVTCGIKNCGFVRIDVCDTVVEGRVTAAVEDSGRWIYTVNGTEYSYVDSSSKVLELGNEYVLYLDSTGRIVKYGESVRSRNYGVIDRVYFDNNSGDSKVRVIQADGTRNSYVLKDTYEADYIARRVYADGQMDGNIEALERRIITYKLNTRSEIHSIEFINPVSDFNSAYSANSAKVGSVRMAESTRVVDLTDIYNQPSYAASDIKPASLASFTDGEEYSVLGADKSTDGYYRFVIIIEKPAPIMVSTGLSIVNSVSEAVYEKDGSVRTVLEVYSRGSGEGTERLFVDEDLFLPDIAFGTVIAYGKDNDGVITDISVLYDGLNGGSRFTAFNDAYAFGEKAGYAEDPRGRLNRFYVRSGIDTWDHSTTATRSWVRTGFGAIVDNTDYSITVAKIDKDSDGSYYSAADEIAELEVAEDACVYMYSHAKPGKLVKTTRQKLSEMVIPNYGYEYVNGILWDSRYENNTVYSYFKVRDGEITDILVISNEVIWETPAVTPYVPEPEIEIPEDKLIEVYGRITATDRQGVCDAGYVSLNVERAESFEGEQISEENPYPLYVKCLNDMHDDIFVYGRFMLLPEAIGVDTDYTIVSFEPVGTNSVTRKASDCEEININNSYITFASDQGVRYMLSNEVKVYVNGIKTWGLPDAEEYIRNNDIGEVTLVDTPQPGAAASDGIYDCIMISVRKWAVVDSIAVSGSLKRIVFDNFEMGLDASVTIDGDDPDYIYNFNRGGNGLDFSEIKPGDILLIEYDVTGRLRDSWFADIDVCDTVVEGKVTAAAEDGGRWIYTVNGAEYSYIDNAYPIFEIGNEYVLYLDSTGRIVKYGESVRSRNYGVIDRVYIDNNSGDYKVRVIKADGTRVSYALKDTNAATGLAETVYTDDTIDGDTLEALEKRIITYKLNTSSEIHTIDFIEPVSDHNSEYTENSTKVGFIRMAESTQVVDLTDIYNQPTYTASDIKAASLASFIDGEEYSVLGVD
ncbi:MAG: hypothetical protein J6N52_03770, partial [Clostridia bacterium]|nr:hypothetical protein [Clostridia bacterium]